MPRKIITVRPRHHIVLIPGFAGFDALGQLEYYARVTPLFRQWQDAGHRDAVLHYFDNFPTAAVSTRAQRLRRYLAKRILRGEIAAGDTLALVGHSTGGLDIRRLIWDLAHDPSQLLRYDGARDPEFTAEKVLRMIRRIVFLSVPQWGTNIADWVRAQALAPSLVIAELRAAVEASQVPLVGTLQEWVTNIASAMSRVGLLYAVQDALAEAEVCPARDRLATAMSQEAASVLALWLRHMATDFSVINDLTAEPHDGDLMSPAHFDATMRKEEKQIWQSAKIRIQSYVTLGKRPFPFDEDAQAPDWNVLNPCTYPELAKDDRMSARTDIVYRTCYRACAGGPFKNPRPTVPVPKPLATWKPGKIAPWDNDGIVNTASMLWPDDRPMFLVECDHMDIVGHYQLLPAPHDSGRQYDAYDLLKSGCGFDDRAFATVWNHVFDFCV